MGITNTWIKTSAACAVPDSQVIVQNGAKFCSILFSSDACIIFFVEEAVEVVLFSEKLLTPLKYCITVAIVPILESALGAIQLWTILVLNIVIPPTRKFNSRIE